MYIVSFFSICGIFICVLLFFLALGVVLAASQADE